MTQQNTKSLQWMSNGKFSVFTVSYVNTALNQSAFTIHKCYIIKEFKLHGRTNFRIDWNNYVRCMMLKTKMYCIQNQ